SDNMDKLWQDFKLKNNKLYSSLEEENMRYKIWSDNVNYVKAHNQHADEKGFTLGLHSFCDLSQTEVSKLKFGLKLSSEDKQRLQLMNKTSAKTEPTTSLRVRRKLKLSRSVDWTADGFVSEIKDQGTCGLLGRLNLSDMSIQVHDFSNKSFVSTGALESQLRIKNDDFTTLSEQNLIDCSVSYGNEGCDGGLMSQAFSYVKDNNGINPDSIYQYMGSINRCKFRKSRIAARVLGYVNLPIDEDALMEAVDEIGPIAVGIDADRTSFTLYRGGIYFDPACSSENLNHAVLVVGYGTENGKDYWLIKNSWGKSWGEDGYGRIARNKNNHCGIASLAGYPLLI
ncbi:cathepsin L1-like, partial [Brachionus plicatilis]